MKPADLKLTSEQRRTILVLLNLLPDGGDTTTGMIGRALGFDNRYIANYLGPRLLGLARRGFLNRRLRGRKAMWAAGPMIDVLQEQGFLGKIKKWIWCKPT